MNPSSGWDVMQNNARDPCISFKGVSYTGSRVEFVNFYVFCINFYQWIRSDILMNTSPVWNVMQNNARDA